MGKQLLLESRESMRSLLALLFAVVTVAAQNPPPPPDRIWFRQDSLSGGETCADKYAAIKGTSAENKGKAPIILPSDANFKICTKFESGSYTNPQTGEVVERAGRDWAHDSGKKSPCAEGCFEFQYGSLQVPTALTPAQPRKLPFTSNPPLEPQLKCVLNLPRVQIALLNGSF